MYVVITITDIQRVNNLILTLWKGMADNVYTCFMITAKSDEDIFLQEFLAILNRQSQNYYKTSKKDFIGTTCIEVIYCACLKLQSDNSILPASKLLIRDNTLSKHWFTCLVNYLIINNFPKLQFENIIGF